MGWAEVSKISPAYFTNWAGGVSLPGWQSMPNSSMGANAVLIPTPTANTLHAIHHGVVTSTHLGDQEFAMFVHGNLGELTFKVLDLKEATAPVYPANLVRAQVIAAGCPNLESLYNTTTEEDFQALQG